MKDILVSKVNFGITGDLMLATVNFLVKNEFGNNDKINVEVQLKNENYSIEELKAQALATAYQTVKGLASDHSANSLQE